MNKIEITFIKLIKCLFFLIASILFQEKVVSQVKGYEQLIDSSTKYGGLFICVQPLKEINIKIEDTSFYIEYLIDIANYKIKNKVLIDLIKASKYADTSIWLNTELKKSIIIKNKEEFISLNDIISKLNPANKKRFKFYKQELSNYNSSRPFDKNVSYFSRPIFDSTKEFAIIQHENGHGGLSGGGAITLFHLIEKQWKEIGNISSWRY